MKIRSTLLALLLALAVVAPVIGQDEEEAPPEPAIEQSCPYATPIENPWCYNFTRGSRIGTER